MTGAARTASYEVTAEVHPGTLPRILELFALRNLIPHRVKCRTMGDRLLVEVDVADVDDREAEIIAAKIRAIVLVMAVRLQQLELRRAA